MANQQSTNQQSALQKLFIYHFLLEIPVIFGMGIILQKQSCMNRFD